MHPRAGRPCGPGSVRIWLRADLAPCGLGSVRTRLDARAEAGMRKPAFHDRTDAGQAVAGRLSAYAADPDVTVLALPRGGVPGAAPVARALRAPLDVFVVRKL